MSSRNPSERLLHPAGLGIPSTKRSRSGTHSPVVLPHAGAYLCPPGVPPQSVASAGHYLAAVGNYDALFRSQAYIQSSGDQRIDNRYRDIPQLPQSHRASLISSFRPSEPPEQDQLRVAYLPPHPSPISSAMPHQQNIYRTHTPPQPSSNSRSTGPGIRGSLQPTVSSATLLDLPLPPHAVGAFKRQIVPASIESCLPPVTSRELPVLLPLKMDIDSKKLLTDGLVSIKFQCLVEKAVDVVRRCSLAKECHTVELEMVAPYNPQVEAISPTLPNDELRDEIKQSKDELLQNLNRVDRDIAKIDQSIGKLRLKQQQLEKEVKPPEERTSSPDQSVDFRHQSIAQIIYNENKRKVAASHAMLSRCGEATLLPRYYQPSDAQLCQETAKKFVTFKKHLIALLKKRQHACQIRERYLTARYDQLIQSWAKKMERIENSAKKRAKDAKTRECFEKVFPELKKQREDKEKLQGRLATCGNRLPGYAFTEATVEQIADNLHVQEEEERKIYNLAVIPPLMLDARQRAHHFHNENGLVTDPMSIHNEAMLRVQFWSPQERETFKDKYVIHPKNFGYIANSLENKTVQDCVLFYYMSKKNASYKQLVRRHLSKRSRAKAQKITRLEKSEDSEEQATHIGNNEKLVTGNSDQLAPVGIATAAVLSGEISDAPMSSYGELSSCVPSEPVVSASSVISEETAAEGTMVTEFTNYDGRKPPSSELDHGGSGDTSVDSDRTESGCSALEESIKAPVIEHASLSRPVTKSSCDIYGLSEADMKADMRICNSCRCKSIHKRYLQCQMSTCSSSKKYVKHLRPLPMKLSKLPERLCISVMAELQLTTLSVRCCSSCFNRVIRAIANVTKSANAVLSPVADDESTDSCQWSEAEVEKLKQGLGQHGKDWSLLSAMVSTRTEAECSSFYIKYRKKFDLRSFVKDDSENKSDDENDDDAVENMETASTHDDDKNDTDDELVKSDSCDSSSDVDEKQSSANEAHEMEVEQQKTDDTPKEQVSMAEQKPDVVETTEQEQVHGSAEPSDVKAIHSISMESQASTAVCAPDTLSQLPAVKAAVSSPVVKVQSDTKHSIDNGKTDDNSADYAFLGCPEPSSHDGSSNGAVAVEQKTVKEPRKNDRSLPPSTPAEGAVDKDCVRDVINAAIEKTLQEQDTSSPTGSSMEMRSQRTAEKSQYVESDTTGFPLQASCIVPAASNDDEDVAHDLTTRSPYSRSGTGVASPSMSNCSSRRHPPASDRSRYMTPPPPPAHGRTNSDGISYDGGPRLKYRHSPSPRGMTPISSAADKHRMYLSSTPYSRDGQLRAAVSDMAKAAVGPPPLIHEPARPVIGGSIVHGTPLGPDHRRRYQLSSSAPEFSRVAASDRRGGEDYRNSGASPHFDPVAQALHLETSAGVAAGLAPYHSKFRGGPWPESVVKGQPVMSGPRPPSHMITAAAGDFPSGSNSRDLLLSDYMTAQQMHTATVPTTTGLALTARDRDQYVLSPSRSSNAATWSYILMGERESSPLTDHAPPPPPVDRGREWDGVDAAYGEQAGARRHSAGDQEVARAMIVPNAAPTRFSGLYPANIDPRYRAAEQPGRHHNVDICESDIASHAVRYAEEQHAITRERNMTTSVVNSSAHPMKRKADSMEDDRPTEQQRQTNAGNNFQHVDDIARDDQSPLKAVTAASLIDAIIIDAVNHPSQSLENQRPDAKGLSARAQSDSDCSALVASSDTTRPVGSSSRTVNKRTITLGEHIDSIILHDYTGTQKAAMGAGKGLQLSARDEQVMRSLTLEAAHHRKEFDKERRARDGKIQCGPDVAFDGRVTGRADYFVPRMPGAVMLSGIAPMPVDISEMQFARIMSARLPTGDPQVSVRLPPADLSLSARLPPPDFSPRSSLPWPAADQQQQQQLYLQQQQQQRVSSSQQFSPHQHHSELASRLSPPVSRSVSASSSASHYQQLARQSADVNSPGARHVTVSDANIVQQGQRSSASGATHWKSRLSKYHEMENPNTADMYNRSGGEAAGARQGSQSRRAAFEVVHSPASFAPDEREVLRLSVGQGHGPESYGQPPRLVKSASPAGSRGVAVDPGLSSRLPSSLATSHQTMTSLLNVRSNNVNEYVRSSGELDRMPHAAIHDIERRGMGHTNSSSPATVNRSPDERIRPPSNRQQLSPYYADSSAADSYRLADSNHGMHGQLISDHKRSPHVLVSIPPPPQSSTSAVEQQPSADRRSLSGPPSPLMVNHVKHHHWRAADTAANLSGSSTQWPPPVASSPRGGMDHRHVGGDNLSPRSGSGSGSGGGGELRAVHYGERLENVAMATSSIGGSVHSSEVYQSRRGSSLAAESAERAMDDRPDTRHSTSESR